MTARKIYLCPICDDDCPNYDGCGFCSLDDPTCDCDDYFYYNGMYDEDDDTEMEENEE